MKMYEYTSTAGIKGIVPATLHKMIQRGVDVGHVNGGKFTKACEFVQVSDVARNASNDTTAEKAPVAAAKPVKKEAAKKPSAKPAKKAVAKKPAGKKPVAKKEGAAKVSKYGSHPDGTVQFVTTRGIYHGWMGGKITVVKNSAEKVKAELTMRGVTAFADITFEG